MNSKMKGIRNTLNKLHHTKPDDTINIVIDLPTGYYIGDRINRTISYINPRVLVNYFKNMEYKIPINIAVYEDSLVETKPNIKSIGFCVGAYIEDLELILKVELHDKIDLTSLENYELHFNLEGHFSDNECLKIINIKSLIFYDSLSLDLIWVDEFIKMLPNKVSNSERLYLNKATKRFKETVQNIFYRN